MGLLQLFATVFRKPVRSRAAAIKAINMRAAKKIEEIASIDGNYNYGTKRYDFSGIHR